jgi:transcriptional regulator with XRE-family HTH domain
VIDLRAERINRGKSQREMADACGVTRRVIQRAERGSRPDPANALKIAQFLQRQVTDIWPLPDGDKAAA